jgi:putative transposase
VPLDNWVRYWKSQYRKLCGIPDRVWQTDHWDTRLRTGDSYDAKWEYVRNNPVRAGLVKNPEDWPFQGELNRLPW